MQDRLNVSFFVGGLNSPASRFRIYQFLDSFNDEFDYNVYPFCKNKYYLEPEVFSKSKNVLRACLSSMNIVNASLNNNRFFIERMLLYKNIALEKLIFSLAKNGVIVDFDDSIFIGNPNFSYTVKNSDIVIAGNSFLAEWASQYSKKVKVIPTCVNLERYTIDNSKVENYKLPITIGWTGTRGNIEYLERITKPLRILQSQFEFKFVLITDERKIPSFLNEIEVLLLPWDRNREIEQLKTLDIGLMPLPDNLWTRGKCGFKLIQYMAVGILAVGSDVGMNKEIINDGEDGFLCSDEDDWHDKLKWCLSSFGGTKFNKIIKSGHQKVVDKYSVEANRNLWFDSIINLC